MRPAPERVQRGACVGGALGNRYGHLVSKPPRPEWDVLAVVGVGGAIGTFGRWGVQRLVPQREPGAFPWGTTSINLLGCLLMGVLVWFVFEYWAPAHRLARPFLGVGVLGGFTTFSTFALDLRGLLAAAEPWQALAYLIISICGGVFAVWLGRRLASILAPANRPFPDDVETADL